MLETKTFPDKSWRPKNGLHVWTIAVGTIQAANQSLYSCYVFVFVLENILYAGASVHSPCVRPSVDRSWMYRRLIHA